MNFFRKTDKVANSTTGSDNVPNGNKNNIVNEIDKNDTRYEMKMKREDSNGGVEKRSFGVVQDGIAKVVDNNSKVDDAPSSHINDLKKASVDTKPSNNGAPSSALNNDSNNNNNIMSTHEKMGEDDNSDEYTDSDSEYTYETISDDEADQPNNKKSSKGGGWFGFLRGGNKKKQDEEEEYYSGSSEEEDEEEEEEDIVAAIDNLHSVLKEGEEEEISSEDEHIKHPLLNDSPTKNTNITSNNSTEKENEEEEALLMAQAISRVQQRIQNNNGNLYEALDEHDKRLVDSLKGVKDEDTIREVVEQSMQQKEGEEKKKGGVRVGEVEDEGVADGSGGEEKKLIVDTKNVEQNNATAIMMEDTPKVTEIIKSHVVHQTDDQPSLHTTGEHPDMMPEVHTEPLLDIEPSIMQGLENEHSESEDEDDDDEDDEQPTLEEQRSLLSLASEHDRVDVIKELLNDPTLHELLLAGVSSSSSNNNDDSNDTSTKNGENENTVVSFVPPPLHAAVAHGSINAASCLLRMGADPSLRPNVPLPYLSGSYQNNPSQRSGSSGSVTMEEDRNFKKYHDMSAWELAFGSTTVIIEDDNSSSKGVVAKEKEEEEEPTKRGWFGFGSTKPKEEEENEEESVIDVVVDGVAKKRRIKRKLPLNIAPSKLEGIKHAFTAEMLRAIGSDEVDRVSQLLDAGMDGSMEVAGKSLTDWANELDATGCCELFEAGTVEDDEEDEVQQKDEDDGNQTIGQVDIDKTTAVTPTLAQQQKVRIVQDERLAGLSLSDIETLTSENLNLIPALTTCRDDLASEAHICQSILRDVGSGKAGLSSQSLLELVRSLKEQRGKAEEAAAAWQGAWEEREDEVDFFYEEVLDDIMRGELGPVLDSVEPVDPSLQGLSNGVAANNMDDAVKHFIEVDNRVNTLRASIAKLAEESAHFVSEIEHHGMAGALSLTRSLRDEVKEVEKKINLAMMGEGMCRRKIEIIQHRLGHHPVEEDYADETNVVDADRMEDYQLQAIVQQQEQQREIGTSGSNSSPLPVKQPEDHTDETSPGREERDSLVAAANGILEENNFMISNALADTLAVEKDEDNMSGETSVNDIIEDIQEEEVEPVAAVTREPRKLVDHEQTPDECAGGSDIVMSEVEADESPTFEAAEPEQSKSQATDNKKVDVKPSSAIAEGKSTAIVVHSPHNQAGSFSSQILEILLRIVGLRRETSRSNSYHDVEGNPHVMIV